MMLLINGVLKLTVLKLKTLCHLKILGTSMEKQMRAERERRQTILIAEGEKTR